MAAQTIAQSDLSILPYNQLVSDYFLKYIEQISDEDTRNEVLKLYLLYNKLTKYNQRCLDPMYPSALKVRKAITIISKFLGEESAFRLESIPEEIIEAIRERSQALNDEGDSYVKIDGHASHQSSTSSVVHRSFLDTMFSELYSYCVMRLSQAYDNFKQSRLFT